MDKDFEKKVKKKKLRTIAVAAVLIILAAAVVMNIRIEKPGENTKESGKGNSTEVTIEIRCDVLSQDMSKLKKPELADYVPDDGTILPETTVKINEGSTVYDVLNRVCRDNDIQMESSYTPVYESYYVEGINYLYEFDAGPQSGWNYQIDDNAPTYGSSSYKLKGGERILWQYTCDLGKDVGGYVEE